MVSVAVNLLRSVPPYPFVLLAWLCASLWLQRTGGMAHGGNPWHDLAVSILASWVVAIVAVVALRRFATESSRRGLVALLAGLWWLMYSGWAILLGRSLGGDVGSVLAWTIIFALLVWGAVRGTQPRAWLTSMLNVGGIVLLVFLAPQIWRARVQVVEASPVADQRDGTKPDIYVIVLDKYTSGAWLRAAWGYDHTPFEDSLRALGFVVPQLVRANYAHTKLALTSFLEGEYVALPDDSIQTNERFEEFAERIKMSSLWSDARERGYRVIALPTYFTGTREFAPEVSTIAPLPITKANWAETWYLNSPALPVASALCKIRLCATGSPTPYPVEGIRALDWRLSQFASLPDSAGPVLGFLHLLAPHEPYLFDEACGARKPWWPESDSDAADSALVTAAYVAQVRCLDERLLRMVRALLERSDVPPVILLQGDHGHGRLATGWFGGETLVLDRLSPQQLGDRLTVFGAYYFPRADSLLPSETTPVSVMRAFRNAMWNESLAPLPDRSFWSSYQKALELVEIAPSRLRPEMP